LYHGYADTPIHRHLNATRMIMTGIGKYLILFGIVVVIVGLLLLVSPKIPWLGRLPGDILIRKRNFTFYFPLVTSIIISIILTVLINLLKK
jgi:hypothetical protein